MREYLPHSTLCFVCGERNERGLKCRFFVEHGNAGAEIIVPAGFNSYPGIVHGGIQTAMMDEAMGWNALVHGPAEAFYFTRGLEVKFRSNAPIGDSLHIVTEFVELKRHIAVVSGKLFDSAGKLLTEAQGSFVPVTGAVMDETIPHLRFDPSKPYYEKAFRICGGSRILPGVAVTE